MFTKTDQRCKIEELERGWKFIHQNGITKLRRIIEGVGEKFNSKEYIDLYTTVYNMCANRNANNSQEVYNRYRETFEKYLSTAVLPAVSGKHGTFMLREFLHRWNNHKIMVRWMSRFFSYLDRYFIPRKSLPSLEEVGFVCFRDLVYAKVQAKNVVVSLIEREREGEQIERALLKNVVEIFVDIGLGSMEVYKTDFESYMLQDTAAYYSRKRTSWIQEDSRAIYMLKAEECLKVETERVGHYLHASSEKKLLKEVQHQLLVSCKTMLLDEEQSGCYALLRDDKVEDLSRMYRLFSMIRDGLEAVASIFRVHVTDAGMALVKQAEDAASCSKTVQDEKTMTVGVQHAFVRNLIELHERYSGYVGQCFANHPLFHRALKVAFEVFCNKNVAGSTSAELLATFVDNLLRKGGSEKLNEGAVEYHLEKIVQLLLYINEKDLFAEIYRKKLARRLLFEKSTSEEHDRSFLRKLKQQLDGPFTSKMEGMMIDLTLSRENHTLFEAYVALNNLTSNNLSSMIDLSVTVLTSGFWPTYKSSYLALPAEMVKCVTEFTEFYQTSTNHRKLNWIYSLGSCIVSGKFDAKPIELVVTTYQAAVLLLFNGADSLSYSEIKTQVNLADEDTLRLLHSLSCAKYNILKKTPSSKTVGETDFFDFNNKFTFKTMRLKIPLPQLDEKKIQVIEEVKKDRRYAIDAAIVRIMKSRKVLSHPQLVLECVQQLARMFKPDVKMIKKRVEDLLSREYLERDKIEMNLLKYVA